MRDGPPGDKTFHPTLVNEHKARHAQKSNPVLDSNFFDADHTSQVQIAYSFPDGSTQPYVIHHLVQVSYNINLLVPVSATRAAD